MNRHVERRVPGFDTIGTFVTQRDRQRELQQQAGALHYIQSHAKKTHKLTNALQSTDLLEVVYSLLKQFVISP